MKEYYVLEYYYYKDGKPFYKKVFPSLKEIEEFANDMIEKYRKNNIKFTFKIVKITVEIIKEIS